MLIPSSILELAVLHSHPGSQCTNVVCVRCGTSQSFFVSTTRHRRCRIQVLRTDPRFLAHPYISMVQEGTNRHLVLCGSPSSSSLHQGWGLCHHHQWNPRAIIEFQKTYKGCIRFCSDARTSTALASGFWLQASRPHGQGALWLYSCASSFIILLA